ncbi:hypothetical protein MKK70_10030 [Methylobacterium sp. E-041]|uniref:hypothetical protein n=1 Tax=Methylobacterium sp. E-041 TaxID=2836573 RepID=UPI001FBA594C|nr:hypothetical protein [Methylobacterium sp. E-041]MCJ2105705.1 hypothetical protein [Methylobacterium sp. E-041]
MQVAENYKKKENNFFDPIGDNVVGFKVFEFFLSCFLIISIVLQKFAAPGSSGSISIITSLLPAVTLVGLISGVIVFDTLSLLLYLLFVIIGSISLFINNAFIEGSLSSLMLVCILQMCISTKISYKFIKHINLLKTFRKSMIAFSLIGIVQFFIQFVLGSNIAFYLDLFVDKSYIVAGFNSVIPLFDGSNTFKSNGFFFSEPSIFSQYVAIAIIIELINRRNVIILAIYTFAVLCSYSGTGLILIAVYGGFLMVSNGRLSYIIALIVVASLLVSFSDSLQLEVFTGRVNEFSTPGSSGYSRFIAPLNMILTFSFDGVVSTILGKGPGAIKVFEDSMPGGRFATHDPTWAKLIFEYGLVGSIAYVCLIIRSMQGSNKALALPIVSTYFFLGGYLANGAIITLVLFLISWSKNGQKDSI